MPAVANVTSTEGHGLELLFAQQFSERYRDAWNSHQPEQVLSLMTEDVFYEDSAWPGGEIRGHAGVRAFLEATWRAIPDMKMTLEESVLLDPLSPKCAGYWQITGTNTGPFDPPGLLATGHRVSFHGGAFMEFRDGKLSRVRVIYDAAEFLRQLGVLPKGRSRGERFAFFAANLRTRLHRR